MTTSYSSSGVFSAPTTQCWTFKFVAGQVKTSEGMSNLNPDLADRWRSLAELHARAVLPVAGEAWFKIGQPDNIGRSTAAANAPDHAIHLRVFLIQVGQRLGLGHIDQLWLPMTDGRRPWRGRPFAPWRQPIG